MKINLFSNEWDHDKQKIEVLKFPYCTFPDPSFLSDLERRLDAAERKYQEANLETQLKQLEEAKQRQVGYR